MTNIMDPSTFAGEDSAINIFKPGEVVIFKLNTGEEVITKIIRVIPPVLFCSDPIQIIMVPDGNKVTAQFIPFMPHCESNNMIFAFESLVTKGTPKKALLDEYNRATGSIITASPGELNLKL